MEAADWHRFQILTKRSPLMRDYLRRRYATRTPPAHIWMGVSVEDEKSKVRIGHLQAAPAGVRFLSIEPLLGPLGKIDLSRIHWVLLGGESGPRARPLDADWVREVRDQCIENSVAFNFKRLGGLRPKARGRLLDGREWNEFPDKRMSSAPAAAA
jgi:protein gp37